MPCNAVATVSLKIASETFAKIKFTNTVRAAIEKFFESKGFDPRKLERTETGYTFYDKGTYIVIQPNRLSISSTVLNKDERDVLANDLAKYINAVTMSVLGRYIKAVAESQNYKIIKEETTSDGRIILLIEKE